MSAIPGGGSDAAPAPAVRHVDDASLMLGGPLLPTAVTVGQWVVTDMLGSGSFATVYKAHHVKSPEQVVALKVIPIAKLDKHVRRALELEIKLQRSIDHPNIVKLLDVQRSSKYIFIVLEFCGGSDLSRHVRSKGPMTEAQARRVLQQLASGLHYLWERHLVHRDLKPSNLLLTTPDIDTAQVKLADFGFARHLEVSALAETLCGSPLYMSPELLRMKPYDARADLWSTGVLLVELLTGRTAFTGRSPLELLHNIERSTWAAERTPPRVIDFTSDPVASTCGGILPPAVATRLSPMCKDLIWRLLRIVPAARISFEAFFRHPWLLEPSAVSASPAATPSAASLLDALGQRASLRHDAHEADGSQHGSATSSCSVADGAGTNSGCASETSLDGRIARPITSATAVPLPAAMYATAADVTTATPTQPRAPIPFAGEGAPFGGIASAAAARGLSLAAAINGAASAAAAVAAASASAAAGILGTAMLSPGYGGPLRSGALASRTPALPTLTERSVTGSFASSGYSSGGSTSNFATPAARDASHMLKPGVGSAEAGAEAAMAARSMFYSVAIGTAGAPAASAARLQYAEGAAARPAAADDDEYDIVMVDDAVAEQLAHFAAEPAARAHPAAGSPSHVSSSQPPQPALLVAAEAAASPWDDVASACASALHAHTLARRAAAVSVAAAPSSLESAVALTRKAGGSEVSHAASAHRRGGAGGGGSYSSSGSTPVAGSPLTSPLPVPIDVTSLDNLIRAAQADAAAAAADLYEQARLGFRGATAALQIAVQGVLRRASDADSAPALAALHDMSESWVQWMDESEGTCTRAAQELHRWSEQEAEITGTL